MACRKSEHIFPAKMPLFCSLFFLVFVRQMNPPADIFTLPIGHGSLAMWSPFMYRCIMRLKRLPGGGAIVSCMISPKKVSDRLFVCINRVDHPLSRPGSRISFLLLGVIRDDVQASIQNPNTRQEMSPSWKGWCGDGSLKVRFLPCANVVVIKLFFLLFYFCNSNSWCPFSVVPPAHNSPPFHDVHTLPLACRSIIETGVSHTGLALPAAYTAYAYFFFIILT